VTNAVNTSPIAALTALTVCSVLLMELAIMRKLINSAA
jgi:hypothetical protein